MEVTAREAFKLGFLQRCAEEKLSPEQIERRIKMANEWPSANQLLQAVVKQVHDKGPKHPYLTGGAMLGLGLGLPAAAGWGAGTLARKLQGDFLDPEDVQKQELINEMNTLSDRSRVSQSKALGL